MTNLSRLFLASLLFSSAFSKETPDKEVVYKTIDGNKLSLFIFNPDGHNASDKTPAIVFFFGGGWNGGTPSQFYPQSRYLASRGMVAICADYRTKKSAGTDPRKCVQDGKSAIRWIRRHAEKLGIDPNKLAAGGGSAGGHVAATTATTTKFDEPGENASLSCRPDALVLFNPVYDNGPGGYGHDRVKAYWKDFSPMHNLTKKTPPTITFLGTKDKLIPVSTAREFRKRMNTLGVRSDLHLYEGQPHGFFNKAKYYETTLETDRFLSSLGYLKGKPTLKKK